MEAQLFYTIDEARGILRIGRTLFYGLVNDKKIRLTKIAGKSLVKREDLEAFIAGLANGEQAA